ncbi:hypothetical protein [Thiocapsa bogorovii]|uniref:hypothetical protein n=1 Tax=Thiocapsa bogorovii TaxID=521689 RepID=UPI001E4B4347|nr:hypothetical protein [Thiocapsa bogorovii]UHD15718.1 hypothetical protein LT988_21055 [Thiocapsa bogorovii]
MTERYIEGDLNDRLDALVRALVDLCTRDEAGPHFTETTEPDVLDQLERLGWIEIIRPTHPTGIPCNAEDWTVTVTEAGLDMWDAHVFVDEFDMDGTRH